jgi:hypothetical protein
MGVAKKADSSPSLKSKRTGPGKPFKMTEEELRQVEIMSGLGLRMSDISLILGCSEATLYNKQNEDPRIKEAFRRGNAKAASQVAQTAFTLAKSGKHPAMTMFWLKCRQRWKEIHVEEHKGSQEIIFKTKIGDKGQIMSEQIEREKPMEDK